MEQLPSIADVVDFVRTAGQHALERQKKLRMSERQVKSDDSVVTAIDHEVEEYLRGEISHAHPGANILGEESDAPFEPSNSYTFAVDPIDGTDSFSQGMPGWTISVGVLNETIEPVAGIVFAPAWDALFFADVNEPATYNDLPLDAVTAPEQIERRTNLLVDSRIHLLVHLENYPGKLRSLGSTALHICGFLTYGAVIGAVSRGARLWDLAGAHAITSSLGYSVEYFGGGEVVYDRMIEGKAASDMIIAGTSEGKRLIRETLQKRRTG